MADIVLVNPQAEMGVKFKDSAPMTAPMGLLAIGSYLTANGYTVKLIDTRIETDFEQQLLQSGKDAICVGFSAMTAQIPHGLILSEIVKEKLGVPVIWGGTHPELFIKQTAEDSAIDYVVYGEGEASILELVQRLEQGKPVDDIMGIAFKKDGQIKITPPRPLIDFKQLPMPNYDLLNLDRMLKTRFQGKIRRKLDFQTSRGCPYQCTFCINTMKWKNHWRPLSAQMVLDTIQHMIDKYRIDLVWFRDENFFVDKNRTRQIVEGMIERKFNILWRANLRADYFTDTYVNDEFMAKMKKSGAAALYMGIEGGSQRMRDFIKKGITEDQIVRSAHLTKKYDVQASYSFMIGLPGETREDIKETVRVMTMLQKINPESIMLGPQPLRPYPGASLYDECKQMGFKEPKTLREWAMMENQFTAFMPVDALPWIDKNNYHLVNNVGKYGTLALQTWKNILGLSPMLAIPALGCKLRWKTGFFRYPLDYKLYKMVSRVLPFY